MLHHRLGGRRGNPTDARDRLQLVLAGWSWSCRGWSWSWGWSCSITTTPSPAVPRRSSPRPASMSTIQRLRIGGAPRVRIAVQAIQIPRLSKDTPTIRSIAVSTEAGTFWANRIARTPRANTMAACPSA